MYCDDSAFCLDLFYETFEKIKNSKLLDCSQYIHVNAVGKLTQDIASQVTSQSSKIKLTNINTDSSGEMDTLCLLWDLSKLYPNSHFLYLHGKGVSKKHNNNVKAWKNYMEHFLIEKWAECVKKLNEHDTCGVNLQNYPSMCYAGNFWWATGDYIKNLPRFNAQDCKPSYSIYCPYNYARAYCEFWLLDNNYCKPSSLHDSGVDHYAIYYDELKYKI